MKLLVLVLNRVNKLEELLKKFIDIGITGATILDSMGMVRVLHDDLDNIPLFGSMRMLINEKHPYNKTILIVLKDEQVKPTVQCIKETVGNMKKPDVGILFTMPIDFVEGFREEDD